MDANNKQIAKNTIFLYFRMLLTMGVGLFTSRVILNTLGIVDYGLNNVVAGVITLFAFLNNALSASTSRFLTFELGTKNEEKIKSVFRTAFNIHFCMALIIVLFCETAGLYIVNNVLVIPPDRLFSCNVIYQYVVITAMLSITQVPLNAAIIAHERMNVYAYLGISDTVLKLIVAYLIVISSFDKLITFGTLHLLIAFGMYTFYHIYCRRNFSEYNIAISRDKNLYREMVGYSTWSLLGSSAFMLKSQGVNILINIFFGPAVNAANAIAYQVNNALAAFSNNFMTALKPQIIKSYAANEHARMKNLIFKGGKFSFFMLMMLAIPVLLETEIILKLWLVHVPEYAVAFTRLIIIQTLIESYAITVSTGIQATGRIRNFQIVVAGIFLLNFPLAYIFYKFGAAPTAALLISVALTSINVFVRLYFLQKYTNISIFDYLKNVFLVSIIVMFLSTILPIAIYNLMDDNFIRLLTVVVVSVFSSVSCIYLIGLQKTEKQKLKTFISNKIEWLSYRKLNL